MNRNVIFSCHHCHACGTPLRMVLDGEQWCGTCEQYRRYVTHGWTRHGASAEDMTPCPQADCQETRKRQCDYHLTIGLSIRTEQGYEMLFESSEFLSLEQVLRSLHATAESIEMGEIPTTLQED